MIRMASRFGTEDISLILHGNVGVDFHLQAIDRENYGYIWGKRSVAFHQNQKLWPPSITLLCCYTALVCHPSVARSDICRTYFCRKNKIKIIRFRFNF